MVYAHIYRRDNLYVCFLFCSRLANYLKVDALNYLSNVLFPVIYTPGYYVVMVLQQINVWITVSVSVERYIAICHPFRAGRLISKKKTIAAMLGITLFSLIYNLPHFFATEAVRCSASGAASAGAESKGNNSSSINVTDVVADTFQYSVDSLMKDEGELLVAAVSTPNPQVLHTEHTSVSTQQPKEASECLTVTNTAFGQTEFYNSYRTIMYLIIIYVFPFIALLILNTFLIRELMTMQKRNTNIGSKEENEANLSLVLVLIVIVFIFCQTPGLISQFEIIPPSMIITWLGVANLLFATNSAVNFLIYTAFGKKFRRVLLRVFRHLSTSNGAKRRRASSASSCHAALTQYSMSNGNETLEMTTLPPDYNQVIQNENT